ATVPALVVQMHARDDRLQKLDWIEDLATVGGMPLEYFVLVLRELSWLVEVHDAPNFADVVHQRGLPHDLHLLLGEPEPACDGRGILRDALGVARRIAVHLVNRASEAGNGLLEGRLKVFVQASVVDGGRSARNDDAEELALSFEKPLSLR